MNFGKKQKKISGLEKYNRGKKWQEKESLKWSLLLRADLINKKELSPSDKKYLKEIKDELVILIDYLLDE